MRVGFLVLALAVVAGCDTAPVDPPLVPPTAPPASATVFSLNAASAGASWAAATDRPHCRIDPDGTGRRLAAGSLSIDGTAVTLRLVDVRSVMPDPPPADTLTVTATLASEGVLGRLTLAGGGTLYAVSAFGDLTDAPTTVVVADPARALGGCGAYRFVRAGNEPAQATTRGMLNQTLTVDEVFYAPMGAGQPVWRAFPIGFAINSQQSITLLSGSLSLTGSGTFTAQSRYRTSDNPSERIADASGSYAATETLVALNPMSASISMAERAADGALLLHHRLPFYPDLAGWPGTQARLTLD